MKGWKVIGLGVALMAVAMWTGTATAGPLAPALSVDALGNFVNGVMIDGKSYIAGEGAAPNTQIGQTIDGVTIGPGAVLHTDWIVRHEGTGVYSYFYQLENSSIFDLNAFNVGAPTFPPSGFFSGSQGFMSGKDLDVTGDLAAGVGHVLAIFANLGDPSLPHGPFPAVNETEKTGGGAALAGLQDPLSITVSSLLVSFGGGGASSLLNVGEESSIIFVKGTQPNYGNWNAAGVGSAGTPVSWGSSAPNPSGEGGVLIPVPVAEPGTLAVLGVALFGSAAWARRRGNRK